MPNKVDLIGQSFGMLKVISEDPIRRNSKIHWYCRCDCGAIKSIDGGSLRAGLSKSCGCARAARNRTSSLSQGMARQGQRPAEYQAWTNMIDRCENPNNPGFGNYGARGIRICHRWRNSFQKFLLDMGKRPSNLHSIERENTNGDYTPENCRWAVKSDQMRNTRRSRIWIIGQDRFETCIEAAEKLGVNQSTIVRRCNGFVQNGKVFPPKHGYSSTLKYEAEND